MLRLLILLTVTVNLSGCMLGGLLRLPMGSDNKEPPGTLHYPKKEGGGAVLDCHNNILTKDGGWNPAFWDENHLPHGTIHFACRRGKAYLPGQIPPELIDLPDDRNLRMWTP